jgi:hypothetical protein
MGKYLSLDRDITFLEIIPIALSIFLWHKIFYEKKIIDYIDNMAVVSVLNSKNQHQQGSWFYLDYIFIGHLHFKAVHISSVNNAIADGQFQKFRELAPPAELKPMTMPWEFWSLLRQSSTV